MKHSPFPKLSINCENRKSWHQCLNSVPIVVRREGNTSGNTLSLLPNVRLTTRVRVLQCFCRRDREVQCGLCKWLRWSSCCFTCWTVSEQARSLYFIQLWYFGLAHNLSSTAAVILGQPQSRSISWWASKTVWQAQLGTEPWQPEFCHQSPPTPSTGAGVLAPTTLYHT